MNVHRFSSNPLRWFRRWLLALVLLNIAARLPLVWDPAAVRNDGAEYLAIARSLQTTGRYATDLKYHFYTDDPVRHLAWADRPPLYPFFAVLCARAAPPLDPTAAARLGNVLAACVALVFAALSLRRIYSERITLLAIGYTFLLPNVLYWTTQPMTESLSLALSFGALFLWLPPSWNVPVSARRALGAGLLAGLTYLTRPTGGLLLAAFTLDALRRREGRRLVPLVAGFCLMAAPYHLLLWRLYGSPFHSSLGYTFSVSTYYEVTYYGFERPMLSTLEYLRAHWQDVPLLVLRQAWNHFQSLFFPLLGFWPLALRFRRSTLAGEAWPHAALVLLTIGVHTAVWSAWGSTRYFILCLPLLAVALLNAVDSEVAPPDSWRRAASLLTALSFVGLGVSLVQFYAREARPDRGLPALPAWREAAAKVQDASLIATDRPATLNLLTQKPAVMLPRTTDVAQLRRFTRKYRPEVLVLFVSEPEVAAAERMAAAWRAGRLPPGWRLAEDTGRMLIARR